MLDEEVALFYMSEIVLVCLFARALSPSLPSSPSPLRLITTYAITPPLRRLSTCTAWASSTATSSQRTSCSLPQVRPTPNPCSDNLCSVETSFSPPPPHPLSDLNKQTRTRCPDRLWPQQRVAAWSRRPNAHLLRHHRVHVGPGNAHLGQESNRKATETDPQRPHPQGPRRFSAARVMARQSTGGRWVPCYTICSPAHRRSPRQTARSSWRRLVVGE